MVSVTDTRGNTSLKMLNFKGFIFDLDGCIFRGDRPIPGARETLDAIRARGIRLLFLTNNSTGTPQQYSEKLAAMGIRASTDEILTSAVATAAYMHQMERGGAFIVGEKALETAVEGEGFTILGENRATEAKYVVCGLDREVTYEKLKAASLALERGARFIASNADPSLPTEEGYLPGAGAIISALVATTKIKPEIVGKPSRRIMKIALRRLGLKAEEVVIVGDVLETDIKAGKNSGVHTVLVLTGVTKREQLIASNIQPDLTLDSVADIMKLI